MQRWRGVSAMVVLAILAGAQLGRADSREADRLFARGRELMAAGELAEACAAFEVVPTEQWNRAVPVDGGTYAIVARAPGAVEWTTSVSIKVQADQYVVEVPSLAAPPKVTESPASVPDQWLRRARTGRQRSRGLVVGQLDVLRRQGDSLIIVDGPSVIALRHGAR